jgi:peptide/nickel transport system permease protein
MEGSERDTGRYLIRRFLFLILVLFFVSVVTFLIFVKLPPGNPAIRAAGRIQTPETIKAAEHAIGLDRPVWVQYWRFAEGLIPWPGLFLNRQVYFSWSNFVPVKDEIYGRLPVTLVLALGAGVIWLLMGIPIGIVSAIKPRTIADRAGMLFALFGVSAPVFWLAYVLLYVFWFKLHVAPGSGIPIGQSAISAALHGRFVLPWLTLALTYMAFYARILRGRLIETMNEDYIRTARAKGLSERRVILVHGVRAAITPIVTLFGIDLGYLLGGAIVVETVFNLQGVGQLAVQSLYTNDFPTVMGVTVLASLFIMGANLVVDVAYAFLDPRVRYG